MSTTSSKLINKTFIFDELKEFDNHHMVVFLYNKQTGLRGFIAIHRNGLKFPSFGATRIWQYKNDQDALRDALQLSRGMSYKSALAGLPYGGAKAIIMLPESAEISKKDLLKEYIKTVNYLGGKFITGADVGINMDDLALMKQNSPYIVGVKNDAVKFTGLGVYYGIKAGLKVVFGKESLGDRSIAIQGMGKTGSALLSFIYNEAAKIYVTDLNKERLAEIKKQYPKVTTVTPAQIYSLKVDVFSPCALSNVINVKNISALQCKIIAGSANAQLENKQIGHLLHKLNILYAPDYVINAGGLIAVADEYKYQRSNEERITKAVKSIKDTLITIFTESKKMDKPTNVIADQMAENIFNNR